jgi:hypothetical protein
MRINEYETQETPMDHQRTAQGRRKLVACGLSLRNAYRLLLDEEHTNEFNTSQRQRGELTALQSPTLNVLA